jgi:hypothetical protein
MSYDPSDAAWDEAYERLSEELYPEHEKQAIREFTAGRLQSYYLANPTVTRAGFRMQSEARALLQHGHHSAALVFAASAAEQFLRVSLLRRVVYGLVHLEPLADLVVDAALAQTGYVRYTKLLSGLFKELTHVNIETVTGSGRSKPLLTEASALQARRNEVVHRAEEVTEQEANHGVAVSAGVFLYILTRLLDALDLQVQEGVVIRAKHP